MSPYGDELFHRTNVERYFILPRINNELFKDRRLDTHFPKSFNDWDPDKGFLNVFKEETYPWRAFFGKEKGFVLKLMENRSDTDQCWGKGSTGYRVISPGDNHSHEYSVYLSLQTFKLPFIHKIICGSVSEGTYLKTRHLEGKAVVRKQVQRCPCELPN